MREHFGCGRHFDSQGPCHDFGAFGHSPRGPPPFGPFFGPHCHGHHGHGPFGHGPHRHGHHGHGPHRHGHHGHGPQRHGHHEHHGPHREFDFFGHRFWGPWGRFENFERSEFGRGNSRGHCGGRFGRGPEERGRRGGCPGNRDANATEETVLVRGIVIERGNRPKSV